MTYCATPIPKKSKDEYWKKDLSTEDKEKWLKAQEILDKAFQDVWEMGLQVHCSYRKHYFMCFEDSREIEELKK